MSRSSAMKIASPACALALERSPQPVRGVDPMGAVDDKYKSWHPSEIRQMLHVVRDVEGQMKVINRRPNTYELIASNIGRLPVPQIAQINLVPGLSDTRRYRVGHARIRSVLREIDNQSLRGTHRHPSVAWFAAGATELLHFGSGRSTRAATHSYSTVGKS